MLRLTKELFQLEPSRGAADYYERALFNQILGGVDPRRGMFTYFQSLRPGGFKVYSDPTHAFWCCVGTGMENPARYAESIYFRSDDALWVNLFVASELAWKDRGVTLRQETQYPDEPATTLTVGVEKPTRFALKLRVPAWVSGEPTLAINGEQSTPRIEDGYATIDREWNDGDKVEWTVPMAVRTEPLEGAADLVAFLYGPVTLAGQLGTEGLDKVDWYLGGHDQNKYGTYPAPAGADADRRRGGFGREGAKGAGRRRPADVFHADRRGRPGRAAALRRDPLRPLHRLLADVPRPSRLRRREGPFGENRRGRPAA